ncbi:MAG: hypothetical protein AOA65_0096 [Candidatus Bathyarchaeota archaeon BA1]|nr:MAG: hypothetical protein AOA65_0096 [Candidatus Bathyarchaeota archaeon BA1]
MSVGSLPERKTVRLDERLSEAVERIAKREG